MNDETTPARDGDTTADATARARAASTLAGHLYPDGRVAFHGIETDLACLGQTACVRAALRAAEVVRSRWSDEAQAVQGTLAAARAWLAAPSDRARREAHRASSRLKPLLRALERRAYVVDLEADHDEQDVDDLEHEHEDLFDDDDFDDDCDDCGDDLLDFDAALAFHAGTAVFAAARAAHARTAATAALHAAGALAAACRVLDLEEDESDLVLPLDDPAWAHCHGGEPRAHGMLTDALADALATHPPGRGGRATET